MQKLISEYFQIDKLLQAAFVLMLCYRFLLPLYNNPLNHIFSDPGRHWRNGLHLLDPSLMGSIDPKAYQLYIWLLHLITGENQEAVALITGFLCASMALVWWGVCTELFSTRKALLMGIIIGFTPSLTAIFTFIMNETLLLTLEGAAIWLALKAGRTKNVKDAKLALIFLVAASYTRISIIPVMLLSAWFMIRNIDKEKTKLAIFGLIIFMVFAIPASWHSYTKLKVIAPLGYTAPTKFYHYSATKSFGIRSAAGNSEFSSPSFNSKPTEPLFEVTYCRPKGTSVIKIDTSGGTRDWEAGIAQVKETFTPEKRWCVFKENIIYFLFGYSWPDYSRTAENNVLYYINFETRWMWFILILLVVCTSPFIKKPASHLTIILYCLALIALFILQQSGVQEGRYRKPLEPLLIISAAILFQRKKQQDDIYLYQLVMQNYVIPTLQLITEIVKSIKSSINANNIFSSKLNSVCTKQDKI